MRGYVVFAWLLLIGTATAQQYVISTYAGGAPLPTPAPALELSIGIPTAVCVDAAENVYFISSNMAFKLDRDGILTRVAGNSRQGDAGDGGPALNAQLRVFYSFSPVNGLTASTASLSNGPPR